jgi:hypothetical protein
LYFSGTEPVLFGKLESTGHARVFARDSKNSFTGTTTMLFIIAFLFSVFLAHETDSDARSHQLSSLFREYQRSAIRSPSKEFKPTKTETFKATHNNRAADLFLPPLPGQSPIDFHPQLKYVLCVFECLRSFFILTARKLPEKDAPLTYYSWHIHTYFFHEDNDVKQRCLTLRQQFMSEFSAGTMRLLVFVPLCELDVVVFVCIVFYVCCSVSLIE